ncbi:MAG: PIN domain-containing protein [Anaerolineales bacterium]|nr:PIN domain-containing protein [Anaerolineales bacterium]
MTRALLDTNVILDLFLDRPPFAAEAALLWQANEKGDFEAYISAITPVNRFYIARKFKGKATAQQAVVELLAALRVCPIDSTTLQLALILPFNDFEDAVQSASAVTSQLDAIITRNSKDFSDAQLPVLSPTEFLKQLSV